MFNQKGQIHIIVLVLFIVGFILYANFSDRSLFKYILPSTSIKNSAPSPASRVSAPALEKQEEIPSFTPVPVGPDTSAPVLFDPQPIGSLPAETRTITLSLNTDERAICRHSYTSGVYYDSMQGKFDQTNGTSHSVLITTLSEGGQYRYYIKCSDELGNKNTNDFVVSFGVKMPADKTPPVLINPSHQGNVLPAGTKEQVISISTNEPASCRYSGSMSGNFSYYDQTKKFHVKTITGLADGRAYDFFVRCQDFSSNSNTGDVLISFIVSP